MTQNQSHKKIEALSVISLICYLLFYLFFTFYDGVMIAVDSPSYIDMSFTREPFYPLLLAFFRRINEEHYLFLTVLLQGLLMAVCGWLLADYLRKRFSLPAIFGIFVYMMPLCTSLLCRFAAGRASMYTNSILTEGICTSLYLLFIFFILKVLLDHHGYSLIYASVTVFLLISSRKQMWMAVPILCLSILYYFYKTTRSNKASIGKSLLRGMIVAILVPVLLYGSFKLFDYSYNYIVRGSFEGHSSSNRFPTTMVFYNAEISDAEYIEDPALRRLFLDIYYRCDEQGYLGHSAKEGWINEVTHFGDHYDHIQIDTMWPMILDHARNHLPEDNASYIDHDKEADRINSVFISSVLPHQIPELLHTLFNNFLSGLVTTVAQMNPILIVYSGFVYSFFILITIVILRKSTSCNKDSIVLLSAVTLLGIISNVTVVSAVIFCQSRYTIYNMPLFYMTYIILIYYCYFNLIKKK